jgi:hypothetical protein
MTSISSTVSWLPLNRHDSDWSAVGGRDGTLAVGYLALGLERALRTDWEGFGNWLGNWALSGA